ncbi:MAG TPA: YjjG family noncanonical pyrimidine nucleotidase [Candidatus Izemoplasmatales bacterium]|nr:YjjG family noncanonical pyrimidine nucleotidase [Candidatus Izemoplasmatales bacterium]
MSYQILFIDADHTLFDFDQSEEIAFRRLLKFIKLEDRFDQLFPSYTQINRRIWKELHQGLIKQDQIKTERFQRFIDAEKINHNPLDLSKQFTKYLSEASILYGDAYEVIEKLSQKFRLVIITNGLKEVQDKRVRHSILSPFIETTIISDEIGISKPNSQIIDYTLDILNHKNRDDVVIIGDNLYSDILCGFNANIDTIWYNPTQQKNTLDKKPTYTISTLKDLLKILEQK